MEKTNKIIFSLILVFLIISPSIVNAESREEYLECVAKRIVELCPEYSLEGVFQSVKEISDGFDSSPGSSWDNSNEINCSGEKRYFRVIAKDTLSFSLGGEILCPKKEVTYIQQTTFGDNSPNNLILDSIINAKTNLNVDSSGSEKVSFVKDILIPIITAVIAGILLIIIGHRLTKKWIQ